LGVIGPAAQSSLKYSNRKSMANVFAEKQLLTWCGVTATKAIAQFSRFSQMDEEGRAADLTGKTHDDEFLHHT
jgi:hypothetical protein